MKKQKTFVVAAILVLTVMMSVPGFSLEVEVLFSPEVESESIDGRIILMLSTTDEAEPRFQVTPGVKAIQIFGVDVEAVAPGQKIRFDKSIFGYPIESIQDVPRGAYHVQALLHRYETFHRGDGHTVKLPMDRGEGQRWNRAPGNLYSTPQQIDFDPGSDTVIRVELDQIIPPIEPATDSEYIKHIQIQSKLLTEFWGRPMFLGAHVLLPHGFDERPQARYPLMIFHGHFPSDIG